MTGATSYSLYGGSASGGETLISSSATSPCTDSGLGDDLTRYYYVVAVNSGGVTGAASAEVSATTTPAASTNLIATGGDSAVTLTWNDSPDALWYNVYRSTTSGGEGSTPYATNVDFGWVDANVVNGGVYYYVVTAVDMSGEGSPSNEALGAPLLPAPTPLVVTPGNASVKLTWSLVSSAATYSVYRSPTPGAEGSTPYAIGVASGWTDTNVTNGTAYYYEVAGLDASSVVGTLSNEAKAVPVVPLPSAPSNIAISGGTGFDLMSFTPVQGALSYNIRRGPSSGGEQTSIYATTVSPVFEDDSVIDGITYFYTITAVNSYGESPPSTEVSATPLDAPTLTSTVAASSSEIDVAWGTVEGAVGYLVEMSPDGTTTWTILANQSGTTIANTGLLAGVTYYYRVSATAPNSQSAQSATGSAATSGTASTPIAPAGLSATPGNLSISLNWSAVYGATSYSVYRSTTSLGEGSTPFLTGVMQPLYVNTGLTSGTPYYYTVTAVNSAGESVQSTEVTATPAPPPSAPTGLTINAGTWNTSLTWTATSGAASYYIYRGTSAGGEDTVPYDSSSVAGYTDEFVDDGTTYYYFVTAVSAIGEGAASSEVSATPLDSPDFVSVTASSSSEIDLSWGAVAGAVTYLMEASPNGFGSWVGLATQSGTTYAHTGLTVGTEYYYRVTALATNSQSDPSNTGTATTTGSVGAPSVPSGLSVAAGNNGVNLSWTPAYGVTSYKLYRSTTTGGEGTTPIASSIAHPPYTDNGLTDGTTYYYTIAAVNGAGTSAPSTEVSATPAVPTVPAAPTGLTAAAGNNNVILNWAATTGADYYNIYRSTTTGGPYTQSNAASVFGTTYDDTAAVNGTPYFYVLTAANAGGESGFSSEATATPVDPPSQPSPFSCTVTYSSSGSPIVHLIWGVPVYHITGLHYAVYRTGSVLVALVPPSSNYTSTFYNDTSGSLGQQYQYWVVAYDDSGSDSTSVSGLLYVNLPTIAPSLLATPVINYGSGAGGQVVLKWSVVTGATGYRVWRTDLGFVATVVGGSIVSWTDTSVTPNTTYYYEVMATSATAQSPLSTPAFQVTTDSTLAAPNLYSLTAGSGSILLMFTTVPHATTYTVHRFSGDGTNDTALTGQVVLSGASASYTDTTTLIAGTVYTYYVVASNSAAYSTSNQRSIQAAQPTSTSLKITPSVGSNYLTWTQANATGYDINRGTGPGGEALWSFVIGATSTWYSDSAALGVKYYYTVSPYGAGGSILSTSNEVSATAYFTPQISASTPVNNQILLTWIPYGTGVPSYKIYRGTSMGGEVYYKTITSPIPYPDTSLPGGLTYWYRVSAVYSNGIEGALSNEVSAQVGGSGYSLSAAPTALSMTVNTSAPTSITVIPQGTYTGTVTLTESVTNAAGTPLTTGVTARFSGPATSITVGINNASAVASVLTVNVAPGVSNGLYYVYVGDGGVHTPVKIAVTVTGGMAKSAANGVDPAGHPLFNIFCPRSNKGFSEAFADSYIGNLVLKYLDPIPTRGYPLLCNITVNSQVLYIAGRPMANAEFTYDIRVGTLTVYDAYGNASAHWGVVDGDGTRLDFGPETSAPSPTAGIYSALTTTSTGFKLSNAGPPEDLKSYGAFTYLFDSAARLTQITDPMGNVQAVSYDGTHRPTTVVDQSTNKALSFSYSSSGSPLIASITTGSMVSNVFTTAATSAVTKLTYTSQLYTVGSNTSVLLQNISSQDMSGTEQTSVKYQYNPDGSVLTAQPDANLSTYPRTFTFNYQNIPTTSAVQRLVPAFSAASDTFNGTVHTIGGFTFGQQPSTGAADTVTQVNAEGGTTTDDYNSDGDLIKETLPAVGGVAGTTSYAYSTPHLVHTVTDSRGTTTYLYDSHGHVDSTTDANSHLWTDNYGGTPVLQTTVGPLPYTGFTGSTTETWGYTDSSQPNVATGFTDELSHVWGYAPNAHGQITTATPPSGSVTGVVTTAYDETTGSLTLGYPKSVVAANGDKVTFDSYDSLGDVTAITTYPSTTGSTTGSHQTGLLYDASQRLTKVTNPDGTTSQIVYKGGFLDHTVDEAMTTFNYTFCSCGQPVGIVGPLGWSVGYKYNNDHQLQQFTDPNTNSTNYGYDLKGDLHTVTYPDSSVETSKMSMVTDCWSRRLTPGALKPTFSTTQPID